MSDVEGQLLEVARSALQRFGMPYAALSLLREEVVGSGIRKRQIYFVIAGPGRYVLRIYRPSFSGLASLLSSQSALCSQQHWLESLAREHGLSVPMPKRALDGQQVVEVHTSGLDEERARRPRLGVMQSFLSGEEVPLGDLGEAELRLLGVQIGRLHRSAQGYVPPEGFTRPTWDWEHVFGPQLKLWRYGREYFSEAEMSVLEQAARVAWWELKALGKGQRVFGMIHRDLHPANFLFEGEGESRSVRIVDFDACGWGYYLYDLAFPMFAISHRHRAKSETAARLNSALISGYGSQAPLPFGYEHYMDTFVMMRRVSRVSILLSQTISQESKQRPEFLSESVELLGEYLETRDKPGPKSFLVQRTRNTVQRLYGS